MLYRWIKCYFYHSTRFRHQAQCVLGGGVTCPVPWLLQGASGRPGRGPAYSIQWRWVAPVFPDEGGANLKLYTGSPRRRKGGFSPDGERPVGQGGQNANGFLLPSALYYRNISMTLVDILSLLARSVRGRKLYHSQMENFCFLNGVLLFLRLALNFQI